MPPITRFEPTLDTKAMTGSASETALLRQLDAIRREAEDVKRFWIKDGDTADDLALYRGTYAPDERKHYFALNFVQAFIDRMTAQLTDNRPIIRIEHRKIGLKNTAAAIEKAVQALWHELDMQRETFKLAENAAITRSAGLYTGYDSSTDSIYLELLRQHQVFISPDVIEAAEVDRAEYIMIDRVRTLDELRHRFPVRGSLVKADAAASTGGTSSGSAPLNVMLDQGSRVGQTEALPRAVVTEYFITDRQTTATGDPLFPNGRRIVCTKDIILWDGPNTYWDGRWPVDWFDWIVDPGHPYGLSEPNRLKRLQVSFNEVMDGLVENQILSNVLTIVGDYDALTPKQWNLLAKLKNSLALAKRNRNASVQITPPPPFGADKITVARTMFSYAQLLTGVTDVTLGENPGSLQSGVAIEGLQEGAALMTRARASRLEDFYARVGQKLIARIFQFMTSDRMLTMLGPTDEAIDYAFQRLDLFTKDDGSLVTDVERKDVFKYLRFAVVPGSSAPGSRARRADMMVRLHTLGAASRKMVLRAADFADPDQMLTEAENDFKTFPPPGFKKVAPKAK